MLSRVNSKGTKPLIMPGNVRAVHVVSLADDVNELGTGISLTKVAEKTGADSEFLISVLSAAEMLGLVRSEKGSLFITEEGLKLKEVGMAQLSVLLKEKIAPIEPFRTAIELASKNGTTTAREVAKSLKTRGIEWHYKPEMNESLVKNLLIHWGIRAGLLSYDGKSQEFALPT
jgi:hypothetical protein